jgi:nitronate monooxygenase
MTTSETTTMTTPHTTTSAARPPGAARGWPRDGLAKLLGIDHPIVQAPMASVATPALAAAVSEAGGLGSLGCALQSAAELRATIDAVKALTRRPVNYNFFAHPEPVVDPPGPGMRARLAAYHRELGLGDLPEPRVAFPTFGEDRLAVLLEARPAVVSFHFGLPPGRAVAALRAAGVAVLASATTVSEARALEARGASAIVAQGWEAGGHRGTFAAPFADGAIGTMALVPQIVDAVAIPVLAAGGIMDGRGIAAAFMLGASGVQMGTAFVGCPEAKVHPAYRAALLEGGASTRVTRALTGRPARVLENRFVAETEAVEAEAAPFPVQGALTARLREASAERGDGDFAALYAGQGAGLARARPAGALVAALVEEALGRLAGGL